MSALRAHRSKEGVAYLSERRQIEPKKEQGSGIDQRSRVRSCDHRESPQRSDESFSPTRRCCDDVSDAGVKLSDGGCVIGFDSQLTNALRLSRCRCTKFPTQEIVFRVRHTYYDLPIREKMTCSNSSGYLFVQKINKINFDLNHFHPNSLKI